MEDSKEKIQELEAPHWRGLVLGFFLLAFVIVSGVGAIAYINFWPQAPSENTFDPSAIAPMPSPAIVDGIDVESGLIAGKDYLLVKNNCTYCHSAKLITQNRMSRTGWESTIRWMQETQNLPDLYENEGPILDYLATFYAPTKRGRRAPIEDIEWYELKQ